MAGCNMGTGSKFLKKWDTTHSQLRPAATWNLTTRVYSFCRSGQYVGYTCKSVSRICTKFWHGEEKCIEHSCFFCKVCFENLVKMLCIWICIQYFFAWVSTGIFLFFFGYSLRYSPLWNYIKVTLHQSNIVVVVESVWPINFVEKN